MPGIINAAYGMKARYQQQLALWSVTDRSLPLNWPASLWLQEKQQLISQLNTDISNALSHLESCVGQLTLHAVGSYEAKKPSNLLTGRSKHR